MSRAAIHGVCQHSCDEEHRPGGKPFEPQTRGWPLSAFRREILQLKSSARCTGAASFGYRCGMCWHTSRVGQRPSQQHLHLGVDAAELVVGPTDQRVMDGRIEAKQDLPALAHVYSEPVFTTGDGG